MKKLYAIALLFMIPVLFSCEKEPEITTDECREIAWNSLSEEVKAIVITDYKTAKVNEESYEGRKAFRVLFLTTDTPLLGLLAVYVYADTKTYAGIGIRY